MMVLIVAMVGGGTVGAFRFGDWFFFMLIAIGVFIGLSERSEISKTEVGPRILSWKTGKESFFPFVENSFSRPALLFAPKLHRPCAKPLKNNRFPPWSESSIHMARILLDSKRSVKRLLRCLSWLETLKTQDETC